MKNFDRSKIKIKELWILFITFAIPLISVGGASAVPYHLRLPLIYSVGVALVFAFIFTDTKISINVPNIIFAALVLYIALTMPFSLDQKTTMSLFLIYLSCFPLLFLNISPDKTQKIIFVCYVICIVIAVSIIISVPIKDCMNKYFWFIVNPTRSPAVTRKILNQLALGGYAGFATDMGEAAYIMNIGVAISFAEYFTRGKFTKKNLGLTVLFLCALALTGKRTYFITAIICFLAFMIVSKVKEKFFKIASIGLASAVAIFSIMMFIPSMANIFYRLSDVENIALMGGRTSLWEYAYQMISEFPIFGGGFGAYNEYAYQNGLRTYEQKWTFNAHNSYLQIFGELGIVGFSLLALFMLSSLVVTVMLLKKMSKKGDKNINLVYYSMYIQIMTLIYSLTGNPLYTKQYIFTWLFAIGIVLNLNRREKETAPRLRLQFDKVF